MEQKKRYRRAMGRYVLLFNETKRQIAADYESSIRHDLGGALRRLICSHGWALEDKMSLVDYFDYHEPACELLKRGYKYVERLGFEWNEEDAMEKAEKEGDADVSSAKSAT